VVFGSAPRKAPFGEWRSQGIMSHSRALSGESTLGIKGKGAGVPVLLGPWSDGAAPVVRGGESHGEKKQTREGSFDYEGNVENRALGSEGCGTRTHENRDTVKNCVAPAGLRKNI
jgi:hypothetical protein